MILGDVFLDCLPAADNRDVFNIASPFVGIIVNDTARLIGNLGRIVELAQDDLPCRACADDHDVAVRLLNLPPPAALQVDEPVAEPRRGQEQHLHHRADQIIGNRHSAEQQAHSHDMKQHRDHRRHQNPVQLRIAGKPPDAVIQMQKPEYNQADNGVDWREFEKRHQKLRGDFRKLQVKPDPQAKKKGKIQCNQIVNDQIQRNNLPMRDFSLSISLPHPLQ